jgi:hypothetical protein
MGRLIPFIVPLTTSAFLLPTGRTDLSTLAPCSSMLNAPLPCDPVRI